MMEIIHHSLVRVTHITLIPCHRIESQIRTRKVSKMCAADRKHGNLKFITGNISNQIGNVGQIACAQLGLTYCLDSVKTDLSLTESTVRTSAAKAPSLQKKELGWLELMPQNLIDTQISQTKHLRTLCHLRTRKKKKKKVLKISWRLCRKWKAKNLQFCFVCFHVSCPRVECFKCPSESGLMSWTAPNATAHTVDIAIRILDVLHVPEIDVVCTHKMWELEYVCEHHNLQYDAIHESWEIMRSSNFN